MLLASSDISEFC